MHIDIAIGTVLGASEYVAEAMQAEFENAGHSVTCHFEPNVDDLSTSSVLLICSSTHGAGDLPENIETFAKQLSSHDLKDKQCMIVGLGDSSYDTYCGAALTLQTIVETQGATLIFEPLHIDVLHHPIPEETAVEWIKDKDLSILD